MLFLPYEEREESHASLIYNSPIAFGISYFRRVTCAMARMFPSSLFFDSPHNFFLHSKYDERKACFQLVVSEAWEKSQFFLCCKKHVMFNYHGEQPTPCILQQCCPPSPPTPLEQMTARCAVPGRTEKSCSNLRPFF